MPRRLLLAALAAALLAFLIAAPAALGDAFSPESGGSENANDIDTLYKIALYVSIVIFLIVEGTLLWALMRYRRRRSSPEAAQIRGNTPLELGWTVGAALILVVLTVVTFVYLDDIENPPPSGPDGLQASQARFASIDQPDPPASGGPVLRIEVDGLQYLWRYVYPGDGELFSYHTMVVPVDTTVVLEVTGSDVIHSWWIPKLGGKVDAVPGHVNETWFKIPAKFAGETFEEGTVFDGQCAELCGAGHADMRAEVRAVTPEQFETWAEEQRTAIQDAGEALAEEREQREGGGESSGGAASGGDAEGGGSSGGAESGGAESGGDAEGGGSSGGGESGGGGGQGGGGQGGGGQGGGGGGGGGGQGGDGGGQRGDGGGQGGGGGGQRGGSGQGGGGQSGGGGGQRGGRGQEGGQGGGGGAQGGGGQGGGGS
jgi:cytochrome c oxidase subunit 2